ncbi:hypothetical protein [Aliigemmobacter aestuarii]|uniref:hypothetical protein n=1 Tax=Aliigemmobacter aestuarii TaxID=1445661 RepID=UPI001454C349|nr:hypothetical protein [Gemmobacter aestuarii]
MFTRTMTRLARGFAPDHHDLSDLLRLAFDGGLDALSFPVGDLERLIDRVEGTA